MLNILKFIYSLIKVSRPVNPAKNDINIILEELKPVIKESLKTKVDYKEIIYRNTVNDKLMGEWGEYIISKPIYPKYDDFGLLNIPHHNTKSPFVDLVDILGSIAEIRLVEYKKENKQYFVFFIIPSFAILFRLFASSYRLYIISHLLLSNYLEQLRNTIYYIFQKSEVEIKNVLSVFQNLIHLLIFNFNFYGNAKNQST